MSKPELHLCQPCRIKQGFKRKDKGCHAAILSYCKSCGESSGILSNLHWKQISAPLKDDLREQLHTANNIIKQLNVDLALAKNKSKSDNYNSSRLKQALEIISEWNSLSLEFRVKHGSDGARDFYRQVAQDALDIVKKLEG
jgi:hypothetical protein